MKTAPFPTISATLSITSISFTNRDFNHMWSFSILTCVFIHEKWVLPKILGNKQLPLLVLRRSWANCRHPGPGWGSLILSTNDSLNRVSLIGFTRRRSPYLPRSYLVLHLFPHSGRDTTRPEALVQSLAGNKIFHPIQKILISGKAKTQEAEYFAFWTGWPNSTAGQGLTRTSVIKIC